MKRCACGSALFSLALDGLAQGELCDVCYWRRRALAAEAELERQRRSVDEADEVERDTPPHLRVSGVAYLEDWRHYADAPHDEE